MGWCVCVRVKSISFAALTGIYVKTTPQDGELVCVCVCSILPYLMQNERFLEPHKIKIKKKSNTHPKKL